MIGRPMLAATLAATSALALLAGCSEKSEIAPEPSSGGAGGGAGSGATASGGSSGTKALACPATTAGPQLIFVQTQAGAGYCIDQREVTRGEYRAFLNAKAGDVSGQPAGCAWNKAYTPVWDPSEDPEGAYACPTDSWALETYPDYPVVCVDICDAIAYCAWAGKRLCGVVGASASDLNKVADHKSVAGSLASEWTYACTQGGKTKYPYGDVYEAGKCIDKARIDAQGPEARKATTDAQETCHGSEAPFDEIFHMSASVQEWVNICDTAQGVYCTTGGGAAHEPPQYISCMPAGTQTTQSIYPSLGIRCCADAVPAGP